MQLCDFSPVFERYIYVFPKLETATIAGAIKAEFYNMNFLVGSNELFLVALLLENMYLSTF